MRHHIHFHQLSGKGILKHHITHHLHHGPHRRHSHLSAHSHHGHGHGMMERKKDVGSFKYGQGEHHHKKLKPLKFKL